MEETKTAQKTRLTFPKGFLLGAAAAAHQVEGNNTKNDWWRAEEEGKLKAKSGLACDHYNRYEEDFQIAKKLGLNALRISIEWSRIEPQEGKWNSKEIEHYRTVLQKMKDLGLTRMVTLFHFTLPVWVADSGGFENQKGVEAFARFAWFVAENLGNEIDLWCTINEPGVYTAMGYRKGLWPPFKKSTVPMISVYLNLIKAHKSAYHAIKEVIPEAQVGIAKNNPYNEPFYRNHWLDRLLTRVVTYIGNHYFLDRIQNECEFIGLNYYFYHQLRFHHKHGGVDMNRNRHEEYRHDHTEFVRSDLGWRLFPEGLYHLLKDLKKYSKPIYITENGLADAKDAHRYNYISEALSATKHAIDEGVDVRGYFYWSLTDNFEWHEGFWPRFGLVEIDYETQKRTVRDSAKIFKEIKIE
ncbi:MAG: glycoside hydrolase family 1 protein [Candidatus Doudnabacteria bacterium]|nr:glycoside hydrolase family 1 protein [Candidatus Doudnabacteria bacterium]